MFAMLQSMWSLAVITVSLTLQPPIEAHLQQVVSGQVPCKSLIFRYQDGSATLGRTVVRVRGAYARIFRYMPDDNEPRIYAGAIGRSDCRRLARQLLRYDLQDAKRRVGELQTDETAPEILIRIDGGIRLSRRRAGFSVQNDPGFAVLRGEFLRIARHLSDGKVRW